MKTLYISLVTLFIFLSNNTFAQNLYVNPQSGVNMRKNPSVGDNVVESLPQGSRVEVVDKSNPEWYKVRYKDKNGQYKEGFVSAKYLSEDRPAKNNSANNSRTSSKSSSTSRDNTSSGNNKGTYSSDKNWGIGVRGGDPSGISIKKYFGDNKALELSVGRPAGWWYSDRYYRDRFYHHRPHHHHQYNYPYHHPYHLDHRYAIAIQLHYLIHNDLLDIPGLQWYYGGGLQLRNRRYSYHYQVWHVGNFYANEIMHVNDPDFGLDMVAGLEFTIPDVPISIFLDATIYTMVLDRFGMLGQVGLGARFNF
ncbi:MAG: SH3 domain-containing protein [Cytophagaceae bacterium]